MIHVIKQTLTVLLLCFQITALSQSAADDLAKAISLSRMNIPGDQVFLHLDRNLYHPGDTIRFQAYVRDRNSGVFGSESISLYSILLNQANKTIDSARFRIVNSTTSGWLSILETIPNGTYTVLAYTSMMMNYDPEFVFSVPVRIDELKALNIEKDLLVDNKSVQSYQLSSAQSTVDLRFLPEGGTFICNNPQRIAFNAVSQSGKCLKVNGEIINQRGEKVTDFISGEFGPGCIELTPSHGDTLFATLKGKEYSGIKWALPIPKDSGVAIRVNNDRKGIIDIYLAARGVEKNTYILAVTMNNSLILSREVRPDSLFRLSLKTEELPEGTAYVTLYDFELNPVAERLIFVNNDKKMNIKIGTSSSAVKAGEETELILNTTDNEGEYVSSFVSISVIDSLSGLCSTLPLPDIEGTFLYDKNFYNNLPSYIKIHGLNIIDKQSIDLLLMTYGWRKFSIKESLKLNSDKELIYYDYLKVSNIESGRNAKLGVHILTLEDADILTFPVNKQKEAIIQYNLLNDNVRRIRILADNKSTKNLFSAKIEFPENLNYTARIKRQNNYLKFADINIPDLDNIISSGISTINSKIIDLNSFQDSVVNIEEVIIKPKRMPAPQHIYLNKYEKLYQSASLRTLTNKDFAVWPSIEYILALFNPYYLDINDKSVYLSLRSPYPALFVLDDDPIGCSYERLEVLPTCEIASITIIKGNQGFGRYGTDALGGVVFVTTKDCFEYKKNDDLLRSVRLFRTEIEYYTPTKEEVDTNPKLQHRPTILWMNDVFIDGKEPVKIRFPNNLTKGTALIFVNGVSLTNQFGSNSYKYKIR